MSTSEEELRKNRFWKALSGYQKHMTLMYFYRLLTDADNILDYIETYRFQNIGIDPFDLPDFIFYLRPAQLKEMALEQPLTPIPPKPEYPARPKAPGFSTRDFSNYLPEVN